VTRKIILTLLIFILNSNCSFDTRSGIWTGNEKIKKTESNKSSETILFKENKIDIKEFNINSIIKTPVNYRSNNNFLENNNQGPQLIISKFNKKSKYKFSKIKYFKYFNPELVFYKNDLIFFDKKGSIIRFDDTSKVIWKKNNYSKSEKKLLPILNFSSNNDLLIVTDNLTKYYALNIKTGKILWTKNHKSIFISEIKVDENKFYVIDSNNKLNCFSLINGEKIWEFQTDNDLIKSQKKLSIVYDDKKIYFNNSRGDIYSLDKDNGNLIWLTPTRTDTDSLQSFLLKTSKLVLEQENLFFSNNKNNFFSLNTNNGIIEWTQNINSFLKPVIAGNIIFSISSEGFLFVVDKTTGNIIRITDLYKGIKSKKMKNVSISGFVVGAQKIYLSLDNGKVFQIDISNGKVSSIFKISSGKISEPFVNNGKIFIVKNNEIIKLN
jgi:outer membrane protein assembly factor BamB